MKSFLCLLAALFPLTLFGQAVSRTELRNTNTLIDARMALRDGAVSNAVRSTHIRVEDFGAVTNQANFETNWVAAVKTASARGGGLVTLETPGTYLLYNAGTNVFTTAFRKSALFTNILNVEFRGGAGVEIRLHDNQQRNSGAAGLLSLSNGPVDLVYNYRCTNFTFSGAWTLNGNTAGQTAWTNASPSARYSQVTSGNLIRGSLCQNVSVIGLGGFISLSNVFSNPIEFSGNNFAQVRNVRFANVGEGMQFSSSKDNVFQNLWTYDLNSTMVGDCYETATCTNTYASEIYAFHGGTNRPASFWDAGGSRGFFINGFYGEWPFGFAFGDDAFSTYPRIDNYRIENGTLKGEGAAGNFGFGGGEGGGLISQVKFIGFDAAIYSDTTQRVSTAISDCTFWSNRVAISIQSISTLDINRNIFWSNTIGLEVTRVFPVELADTNDGPTIHLRGNSFLTNVWDVKFSTDGSHNYATRGQYGLNHYAGNVTHLDYGGTFVSWNTNEPVAAGATLNLNVFPGFTNNTAQWRGDNFVTLGSDSSLIRRFEILTGVGLGYSNVNNGSLLVYGPEDGSLWLSVMDGSLPKRLGRISETVGAGEGLFEIANAGIGALVVTNGLTLRAQNPRSIPAIDGNTNLANLTIGEFLWLDTNSLALNATGLLATATFLTSSNDLVALISGGGVSDTAFASSWNGVTTTAPSKNVVYDWAHIFDTDDDGKVNVLDIGAGIPKTDSGGVVSAIADGTGMLTNNGSGTFGWMAIPSGGSGTPGGNSGAVQFNQGGVLDGSNTFNLDRTNSILSLRNGAATGSESFYLGGSLSVPNWSFYSDTNTFRLQPDFGTTGWTITATKDNRSIQIGSTANNKGTNVGDWYFPSNVTAGSLTASGSGNGAITLVDTANSKSWSTTVTNVTQNLSNIYVNPWPTGPGWCWQVASSNLNATTTFYDVRWTNGPCGTAGGGIPGTNDNQFAASTTLAIKKEALLTNIVLYATNGVAAAADQAGEVIESTNYVNVALSTGTTATLLTNILTPGRWLVTATVYVNRNGATFSGAGLQSSLVATIGTDGVIPLNSIEEAQTTTFSSEALDVINYPQFTTTNRPIYTTLYPGSFSVGTPQAKAVTRAIRQP